MPSAIRVHEHGGPDVLRWETVDIPAPGAGEIHVRHTAIGLNFIDIYYRSGLYSPPGLPFTPGSEAAGVVVAVGDDVADLHPGDRIAYGSAGLGAYSEERIVAADRVLRIPDAIDDETAAAMMLKGMTAQYLLRRTYRVKSGDTILIHAAAGGVGKIVCQWAKHIGATVIGTVGSEEKAEQARQLGCDHPIIYTQEDFVARTREITNGIGVDVVYDSVGATTFLKSLDCLRPLGMMVSFGQSSGPIAPFDVSLLAQKGCLFLTRPNLFAYTSTRDELVATAQELFDVVGPGNVQIEIGQRFPLQEAAAAQQALEERRTTGSTVLLP
jgi:NADPH2:quinone reductase